MPNGNKANTDRTDYLLKYLIALELWKGGLTQLEIRKRLHLSTNILNDMLKGVARPESKVA